MSVTCDICRGPRVRFQVREIGTHAVAQLCSIRCLMKWGVGYGLGQVRRLLGAAPSEKKKGPAPKGRPPVGR
jgi:hypothetical protein